MANLFAKINKQFVLLTTMIQTHINKLQKIQKLSKIQQTIAIAAVATIAFASLNLKKH